MKTLHLDGEVFQAERIVKTETSIIGYNGITEVFAFRGINDFSKFKLENGEEFDLDEKTEQALLFADLYEEVKTENLTLSLALADVYEELKEIKGGD